MKNVIMIVVLSLASWGAHAGIIFNEDFEDGVANGWALSGLWHVTQNAPASGSYALGYVQNETAGPTPNGDFATGSANSGTAVTPTLACSSGPCLISFDWLSIGEQSTNYDIFTVRLIPTGAPSQDLLVNGYSETYQSFSQDVSSIVGIDSFSVSFAFDSVDSIINDSPGTRVDNFQVVDGSQSSVPSPATLALIGLGLAGLSCSRRRKA